MGGIFSVKNKNKLGKKVYKFGTFFGFLFAKFLEGFYSVHIKVRYLHDKTYQKGGWYKKWSDKPYSHSVHRAAVLSFVISFVFFNTLSALFPYLFNPAKPLTVRAGSDTRVWTTQADFLTASTRNSVDITAGGAVQLATNDVYGDGDDLDLSVPSGTFDINVNTSNGRTAPDGVNWTISSTVTSGQRVISQAGRPSGFAVGDEILIINLKVGSGSVTEVGKYEFKRIEALDSNTVTVTTNFANTYNGSTHKIMVQRVPNYNDVTVAVGATLTTSAWNGTKGGVLVFRANGVVTNNGTISLTGKGYRGGASPAGNYVSQSGEWAGRDAVVGMDIDGNCTASPVGGGGGGHGVKTDVSTAVGYNGCVGGTGTSGGAGGSAINRHAGSNTTSTGGNGGSGGYGSVGQGGTAGAGANPGGNGTLSAGGTGGNGAQFSLNTLKGGGGGGGSVIGSSATLSSAIYLGSGGGAGGPAAATTSATTAGGAGGAGGGILIIGANSLTNGGSILSAGTAGTAGTVASGRTSGDGGDGSGGSLYIKAVTLTNNSAINANGTAKSGGGRVLREVVNFTGNELAPNLATATLSPYATSGTLGGSAASAIGLRYDAGVGASVDATSLQWTATTGSADKKVLFKVRSGNDQAELDTNQCYGPGTGSPGSGLDSGCADWVTAGKFFSEINEIVGSGTIDSNIQAKRYLEVLVRIESSGTETPVLDEVTITFDGLEVPGNNYLSLTKTDDSTLKSSSGVQITNGVSGGYTNETSLKVTATNLTCGGGGSGNTICGGSSTNRKIQVQASTATDFSSPISSVDESTTSTTADGGVNYSSTATLAGLSAGSSYHLRARTIDTEGRVSGWRSYGGNESTADVTVEQTVPTGTITIGSSEFTASTNVILALSASDNGGSNLFQMILSNDGVFDTEQWENYATTKAWTLTNGDGLKTVYIKFNDNAGNESNAETDTITLDVTPPDSFNLASPANNTWSSTEPSPSFTWNASSGHTKYELWIDGVKNGGDIASNTTSAAPASPLAEGNHTWTVKAYDGANNVTTASATWNYGYDATVPGVLTDLAASDTNLSHVVITWNAFSAGGGSALDSYKLERVKEFAYVNTFSSNMGADWSAGNHNISGYAAFILNSNSHTDEVGVSAQGQVALEGSVKYVYRVKVKDQANANYSNSQAAPEYGMTQDTADPNPGPTNVKSAACDGTTNYITGTMVEKCSNIANKGFEIAVTWTAAQDSGTGVQKYYIYRSPNSTIGNYVKIAEVNAPINYFYDNDSVHAEPSNRLNDYTTYYYRITALDGRTDPGPNETDVLPVNPDENVTLATTPDVTSPSAPIGVTASPQGLDSSDPESNIPITNGTGTATSGGANTLTDSGKNWTPNALKGLPIKIISGTGADQIIKIASNTATTVTVSENWATEPDATSAYEIYKGHQRVTISWTASADIKARSSENGSGIQLYRIYRDTSPTGDFLDLVGTTTGITINDDSLADFTYYYYKVKAVDNVNNVSSFSSESGDRTASSEVPTTPNNISVTSKKGNPNSDAEVGDKITLTFKGSNANNCLNGIRCLVKYEVYRSATNYVTQAQWLTNATKISEPTPNVQKDDRNSTYTVTDTGLTDATTYYYRIRAIDNSPVEPDGGPFYSALSAVNTGTVGSGWDTTPDATAPTFSSGALEVKVRDTHPNDTELRNIIAWKMLTGELVPTRNGSSDFAKYEVWRELYNPADESLLETSKVAEKTSISDNYYMDAINLNSMVGGVYYIKDCKIKYYIVVVDNAGSEFRYANNVLINSGYSNSSEKEYSTDSIIPSKADPALVGSVTLTNVSVASATINWTTDQETDGIVEFRKKYIKDQAGNDAPNTNGAYTVIGENTSPVQRINTQNHSVRIFGLEASTEYEYRVVSKNYLGNRLEITNVPNLTTNGFNITFGGVTTTTSMAEISWTTNLNAASAFVEYQLQQQLGDNAHSGGVTVTKESLEDNPKSHKVVIPGLRSNRTYYFKIKAISTDDFLAEYPAQNRSTFRTKSYDTTQFTMAPSSSNVAERNITATTALIAWQTAVPTTSWVDYSTKSGVYDMSSGNNDLTTSHAVQLEGLVPGTTYYYRVRVKDGNEVEYTSQEYSFKAILKPKIMDMKIKEITPYSVILSWSTNVETETLINWGHSAAYGEKRGVPGLTKVHEIKVENLEDNTEYHYQVLAKDEAGNEVADEDKIVRTPLDTEGPKIKNVKTEVLPVNDADNTSQVIISWETNKPSTSLIEYDEGAIGSTYSKSSIEDKTLSPTHTVIIKGLEPGTTYRYRILTADRRGNVTTSNDYTFVTPSKEKSILQLIIKSLEETFSWVKNVGQFFRSIGQKTKS